MSRRRLLLGGGTLALMVILLAIYLVLHSPVRQVALGPLRDGCDWFCSWPRLDEPVFSVVSALWLIVAAGLAATPVAGRLVSGPLERTVAWGIVAYALIAVPAAWIAFLGDRVDVALLRPPVGPLLASLPAIGLIAWGWRTGWRPHLPGRIAFGGPTPLLLGIGALVLVVQAIGIGTAIARPPTGFDDLGYHAPLAVLLWREGSMESFLGGFAGTQVLSHPGSAELWQGLLLILGGEPLGVVGQLPFAWLGAAGVAAFGVRLGLGRGAALLAGALFLLAPMVLEQSSHIRNDVVGASLVIGASALVAASVDRWTPGRLIVAGLALGLMAVTKLSLLPAIAAIGLLGLVVVIRATRSGMDRRVIWQAVGIGLLLALLAVLPWWLRNLMREGNPLYPADLPLIGGGVPWQSPPDRMYVPHPWLWPLYPLLERFDDANGLGGAFAVGIVPGIVAAAFLARRRPLAVPVVLALVSIPVLWAFDRREPRFLLGLAGVLFALLPFVLVALRPRFRPLGGLVLAAAVLVTVGAQLTSLLAGQARQPIERGAFYEETWNLDPAVVVLPETEGVLLDDRCSEARILRLYPFFGADRTRRVARVDCEGLTTEDVERTMARRGLTHVYMQMDPEQAAEREALYPPDRFEVVSRHDATLRRGNDIVRVLYRWLGAPADG